MPHAVPSKGAHRSARTAAHHDASPLPTPSAKRAPAPATQPPRPHAAAAHPLGVRARGRASAPRLLTGLSVPACRSLDVPEQCAASGCRAADLHEPGKLNCMSTARSTG